MEPNSEVWREYAYKAGIHPAVMTFLDIKKSYFYCVETTIEGKSFVTPRGWEDLSKMLQLFEQNHLKADEDLVIQYIQNRKIAKEFAVYYDLFVKYKEDYKVDKILSGKAEDKIKKRAEKAPFDERFSLVGLLIDCVSEDVRTVIEEEELLRSSLDCLKQFKKSSASSKKKPKDEMANIIAGKEDELKSADNSGALSQPERIRRQKTIRYLKDLAKKIGKEENAETAFQIVKEEYNGRVKALSEQGEVVKKRLSNMFLFSEEVFGEGQELLIIVTELTANSYCARFISEFGCEEYFKHNKDLLFYERQRELITQIENLGL